MTSDEFAQLLLDKGIEGRCPTCRKQDWRGVEDTVTLQVRGNGTARYQPGASVTSPEITAVAPSCGNCGHIRLFDIAFLTHV
jgi:uncharacterized protein (DUF983 family)